MKRRIFAFVLMLVLALAAVALGQVRAPTLRDEVRKKPFVWRSSLAESRTLATFEDLIMRSDVIIRGRIVDEKVRLSADEYNVWTDYTVEVLEVFKDPQQLASPGGRLVVTKGGGNLILEGKPVRMDTPWFPPIPWIAPHVLFIARWTGAGADGQYYLVGGEVGVFGIKKGKIKAHGFGKKRHPIIREFHNKTEDEFLRLLKEKLATLAESNCAP